MVNIANGHETPAPTTAIDRTERETASHRLHTDRHTPAGPDNVLSVTGSAATATRYLLAGIRLALGWIFLWAFLDKLFGLGHSTVAAKSWLNGGSPTAGFLGKSATGPFTGFYHSIAGNAVADALFMAALLGIGAALILGIGMRIAAGAGAALTVLMWTAVLPPENNPFMDDHLIYAAVLVVLALVGAGTTLGLGKYWEKLPIVRANGWLK